MSDIFIQVRGVKKSFGSTQVLKGVDLEIYKGETVVLLGGSGGGKSVLIKHFLGLLQPDEGEVTVEGEKICQLPERKQDHIRKKIGMMFQNGALFDSLNVYENIAFPLREAGVKPESTIEERVERALEIVRLPGQGTKMPADLSGGMRKRVALARAVVDEPACVLYDEPHAGLDPITADSIDRLIKRLQKDHGMTNVVITHEMRSMLKIADRVVFMKDGKVYWTGTAQDFKNSDDPELSDFFHGRSRRKSSSSASDR